MFARFIFWRLMGLVAALFSLSLSTWILNKGIGGLLPGIGKTPVLSKAQQALQVPLATGHAPALNLPKVPLPKVQVPATPSTSGLLGDTETGAHMLWSGLVVFGVPLLQAVVWGGLTILTLLVCIRLAVRRQRRYARLRVSPYRTDRATVEGIVSMFEALHKRLLRRWWRRLFLGQPSIAMEVHMMPRFGSSASFGQVAGSLTGLDENGTFAQGCYQAWLMISCPEGLEQMVQASLRTAYPNCRVERMNMPLRSPPSLLRLKKHAEFIKRVKVLDRYEHERDPPMNRLLTVMGACEEPSYVQIALTPTPMLFERHAKHAYKHHERHVTHHGPGPHRHPQRSVFEESELRGALEVQHRPLFFVDLRVIASTRAVGERIASELRAEGAENRLVERSTRVRQGLLKLYDRRVDRGEGNPLPNLHRGVFASTELAALWHLPSIDYMTVPFTRSSMPVAPASPAIFRPASGPGTLHDALGPVSIHPELRRQNIAVPGTVEQGKSSYLVATIAEDLRRERCAVIVLDPKGDAAEAAVSAVPDDRTCTLLDFSHPTCGFNPLAANAPADVVADYVVGALRNLFTDADIRASSDRYLRNAIIAVLAHDERATLWDAARILSVGEEGYVYRARVGASVRGIPEFKEISEFFTAELSAQLSDARSMTTAKLDAPVNKLARLLNSPSIKRVLLNESLQVDFDKVISGCEVLVVKGAMGAMGAGNTSVLMQMLVGMLDASLARQQDHATADDRVAVALKIDEAPLVVNRGFAETMALKRSAGLETVACWQTDSQWTEREIREQLDALFAHRVYFATASTQDARNAASLMMAEFSDMVRPDLRNISALGHPDARLHLPKYHAIVSWTTPQGRQGPFMAKTIPMHADQRRIELHLERQAERGGSYRADLRQPHWERERLTISGQRTVSRKEWTASVGSVERARPVPASLGEPEDEVRDRALGLAEHAGTEGALTTAAVVVSASDGPAPPVQANATVVVDEGPEQKPATPRADTEEPGAEPDTDQPPPSGDHEHKPESTSESDPDAESELLASPFPALEGPPAEKASTPADTYRELVELDGAHRLRWAKQVESLRKLKPDELDLEIMALLARLEHVLSSQIHRRFNIGRAATTTQRRLKRLSEAGLVHRFQFHRRDGGGIPMCYVITEAGLEQLHSSGLIDSAELERVSSERSRRPRHARVEDEHMLEQARHDIHVSGWVLALERTLGGPPFPIRGPRESVLSPPMRSTPAGKVAFGPGDLRLPGGRTPHDFWRTDNDGKRTDVKHFETVRPDATVEVPLTTGESGKPPCADLIVELDDRLPIGRHAAKLERYDHLVSGWALERTRYGKRLGCPPLVVFVCRDRSRARECARRADPVLVACRAYPGEYPSEWEYPGRERIFFVAERDIHEGLTRAYGVTPLPPTVRVALADGDPAARSTEPQQRELVPARTTRLC
ncbi:MAG TPA: replication-relaxation family protein [Solirubrobacteraceae bacterium]